jgi:hypothetical protein
MALLNGYNLRELALRLCSNIAATTSPHLKLCIGQPGRVPMLVVGWNSLLGYLACLLAKI